MNKMRLLISAAIVTCCGAGILASCTDDKAMNNVSGVLEEPIVCQAPEQVRQALSATTKLHLFDIMNDTANNISVSGIGETDGGKKTEGYGIVIVKNATSTLFPDMRNSRQPRACYDNTTNNLWVASSVMEGTGVNVEQLYQLYFSTTDDSARIAAKIEPYQMQESLISHIKYNIDGEKVTFFADGVEIATATNTVTNMGGMDSEQPIWIGENISYDLSSDQQRVCFVPGVKFTTGLVLTYDDMPTISAKVTLSEDGNFILSDFKAEAKK